MAIRLNAAKRRSLLWCSLVGFGSSAAVFAMAFATGSFLIGLVGGMLAALTGVDIWTLIHG